VTDRKTFAADVAGGEANGEVCRGDDGQGWIVVVDTAAAVVVAAAGLDVDVGVSQSSIVCPAASFLAHSPAAVVVPAGRVVGDEVDFPLLLHAPRTNAATMTHPRRRRTPA
jgi:hypothetical protein